MENLEQYTKEFFWQVEIEVEKEKSQLLESFFLQSGALGHFELLYQENVTKNLENDFTRLFFFFEHNFPAQAFVPMALATLNLAENYFEIKQIKYQDYLAQFEQTFRSFALTESTWLVPPYDKNNPAIPQGARHLFLKPGLAFGTGKHETSQLMVAYLEQTLKPGDFVIDMGCGSGILAIAAGLWGAERVIGVDVETLAVESAFENAALNQEQSQFVYDFKVGSFDTILERKCEIFVANILPQVFYQNSQQLKAYLAEAQNWALSGIPKVEKDKFNQFLEKKLGVYVKQIEKKGDWLLFAG